jgi:hypothetical protein
MHDSALRAIWTVMFLVAVMISLSASRSLGATCAQVVALLERGFSFGEISELTGATGGEMQSCVERNRIISPVGPAPHGAAGPAPHGAAGRAPHRAVGPAPLGAAGPAPSGAAGPAPHGAAGASPFGQAR